MFIRKGMAFMKNSTKRTLIGALFALLLASCNIHIGPSNSPRETSTEESSFSSSSVSEPDPTLDKLEFVLATNGRSYAVRAKSKDETKGEVVIPSAYQGLPVTVVGDNGFAECSGITSVYLPDTITIIDYKFGHWHSSYPDQVREYKELVQKMYPQCTVEGWLWFVDINKIRRV